MSEENAQEGNPGGGIEGSTGSPAFGATTLKSGVAVMQVTAFRRIRDAAGKLLGNHKSLRFGVCLFLFVFIAKAVLFPVGWAEYFEEKSYAFLQCVRYWWPFHKEFDVVVIDTSHIVKRSRTKEEPDILVTPRDEIFDYIKACADAGATAIGVDVDFSPELDPADLEHWRYISPSDPKFFQDCLDLAQDRQIPIALGVFRARADPEHWLYDAKYSSLAALIAHPKGKPDEVIYSYIKGNSARELPSMSSVLAQRNPDANKPRWPFSLAESHVQEKRGKDVEIRYVFLNSLSLSRLKDKTEFPDNPDGIRNNTNMVRGRIVLLGRLADEQDMFEFPGIGPIHGVYLIAAGIQTILSAPIGRLTGLENILVDFIISFFVVFLTFQLSRAGASLKHFIKERFHHALGVSGGILLHLVIAITVILAVAFGAILINVGMRLFWPDFTLVCIFLFGDWMIHSIVAMIHGLSHSPAHSSHLPLETGK